MVKVITSLIDGYRYQPKFLTEEEAKEYETIGHKSVEISEEIVDKWKEHCKQVESWHKFWNDIDNKIWNEEE